MSLMSRLQAQQQKAPVIDISPSRREAAGARFQEPVYNIHREVIKELGGELHSGSRDEEQIQLLHQQVNQLAEAYLDRQTHYYTKTDREEIIRQVMDEIVGYGPITPLLKDETVSEVMVNGPNQVYVERRANWS